MRPAEDNAWPDVDGADHMNWYLEGSSSVGSSSPSSGFQDTGNIPQTYSDASADAIEYDAGSEIWTPLMLDTTDMAQSLHMKTAVAREVSTSARPILLPPTAPPAPAAPPHTRSHPKRQKSDATKMQRATTKGTPLRYDDGEMLLETVIEHLSSGSECRREDWMLQKGKDGDFHGRVYIEHNAKRREKMTDRWYITSPTDVQETGKYFKEDALGRRSECESTDANVRGTIKAVKIDMQIVLRAPGSQENPGAKLMADGWKVQFHYVDIEGASVSSRVVEVILYHILPAHIKRRGKVHATESNRKEKAKQQAASRVPSHGPRSAPEAMDSRNVEITGVQTVLPMVIEDNRRGDEPDRPFLSFKSHGVELGAIEQHGHGVQLRSRSGDFAECHPREEGEAPFEEGDVVGFIVKERGAMCITRVTTGAKMVGVISRRAIVQGKTPLPAEQHLYDTVAYMGQVPVKVRGSVSSGTFVVPSGRHDGTAVVYGDGLPSQPLGTIIHNPEQSGEFDQASDICFVEIMVHKPDPWASVAAAMIDREKDTAEIEEMDMEIQDTEKKTWIEMRTRTKAWLCTFVVLCVAAVCFALKQHSTTDGHARTSQIVSTVGCFAESMNAVDLTKCNACSHDTVIEFEQQHVGDTIEVACPGNLTGALRRTCSGQNKSDLSGRCVRPVCPEEHVKLPGGTSLTVASVHEGLTQVTECPHPGFDGQLIQQCMKNVTWGQRTGQCTRRMCHSTVTTFGTSVRTFNSSTYSGYLQIPVSAPETEYGHSVQVAICKHFTRTGSCKDNTADAGYQRLTCDPASGKYVVNDESSTFASALSYDKLRMSKPLPLAQSMYRTFTSSVSRAVQVPQGSSWRLPADGVLSSVTIGFEGERREVFATANSPLERSDCSGSIDTNPSYDPNSMTKRIRALAGGRAAASFARVACAELGFNEAPFVTTCQGLASLLNDVPYHVPNATKMLAELCPEVQSADSASSECPNWLELRDPLDDVHNTQMGWLRASLLTPVDDDGLHAAPVFEVADATRLPDWRNIKSFTNAGPVPESPSCDGTETSVLRCFQRQMIIPVAQRKLWKRHCSRRVILGCSKPVDSTRPDDKIDPELGAAIIWADIKVLADVSGFAVSVAVRPADYQFNGQFDKMTMEATVSSPTTWDDSQSKMARVYGTPINCSNITRRVPVVFSAFAYDSPTSFELHLPPQCRQTWSLYRPYPYKIVLRLHLSSSPTATAGDELPDTKPPTLVDTMEKFAKLRSSTSSDGTWVVGDSVRPFPDNSTPLTRPKVFVDTGGPFNCTSGELATEEQIAKSVERLCWGKTMYSPADGIGVV